MKHAAARRVAVMATPLGLTPCGCKGEGMMFLNFNVAPPARRIASANLPSNVAMPLFVRNAKSR